METWEAHGIAFDGERFEWRGLRKKQAIWRYNFLRRGFMWRGKSLKEVGYKLERRGND